MKTDTEITEEIHKIINDECGINWTDTLKDKIYKKVAQAREQGRKDGIASATTDMDNFKKLKFFKKAVHSESIDLDKIAWTENRKDNGRGYVRAYLSRNYGIRITPEAIADEVDVAILYMLHDALQEGQDLGKKDGIADFKARLFDKKSGIIKEVLKELCFDSKLWVIDDAIIEINNKLVLEKAISEAEKGGNE